MKKAKQITEYEKTVALVAGQIYAVEFSRQAGALKDGDSLDINELINECVVDALQIVDGAIEGAVDA